MKEEFKDLEIVKNNTSHRFELTVDGFTAFIDFRESGTDLALIHTESPEELAGRGVAAALVEKTLIYLEQHNYSLLPYCPYVFAFIKKNREWLRVVREDFKDRFNDSVKK